MNKYEESDRFALGGKLGPVVNRGLDHGLVRGRGHALGHWDQQ